MLGNPIVVHLQWKALLTSNLAFAGFGVNTSTFPLRINFNVVATFSVC